MSKREDYDDYDDDFDDEDEDDFDESDDDEEDGFDDDLDWGWYRRYPKSRPREAKGGIRAQSKRGGFGESWWAKRWIQTLESFQIGGRLQRGRSYARSGQVLSIDIAEGKVTAKVQGSRPKPYQVTIQVKPLSKADWRKLAKAISSQAIFVAKLLSGEMPQDIEQVFHKAKLSLFPARLRDLSTDCSCPDWSNPCKHIAAVYYLLGEEFDRDPFLIFRLRGMEREVFLGLISEPVEEPGKHRRKKATATKSGSEPAEAAAEPQAEPLPAEAESFWGHGDLSSELLGEGRIPTTSAALTRRLGTVPFWRAQMRFQDAMEAIYTAASLRGLETLVGQEPGK